MDYRKFSDIKEGTKTEGVCGEYLDRRKIK
jgi:hypothetical protein